MNWENIQGKWGLLKGHAMKEWSHLTHADFDKVSGNKELLIGKLQDRYGWTKEETERRVHAWAEKHHHDEHPA